MRNLPADSWPIPCCNSKLINHNRIRFMNILLIGSGGREHALAWKMAQSKLCSALFIAPGNAGTAQCGTNVEMGVIDFEAIKQFCIARKIDLVVVGPEEPLV